MDMENLISPTDVNEDMFYSQFSIPRVQTPSKGPPRSLCLTDPEVVNKNLLKDSTLQVDGLHTPDISAPPTNVNTGLSQDSQTLQENNDIDALIKELQSFGESIPPKAVTQQESLPKTHNLLESTSAASVNPQDNPTGLTAGPQGILFAIPSTEAIPTLNQSYFQVAAYLAPQDFDVEKLSYIAAVDQQPNQCLINDKQHPELIVTQQSESLFNNPICLGISNEQVVDQKGSGFRLALPPTNAVSQSFHQPAASTTLDKQNDNKLLHSVASTTQQNGIKLNSEVANKLLRPEVLEPQKSLLPAVPTANNAYSNSNCSHFLHNSGIVSLSTKKQLHSGSTNFQDLENTCQQLFLRQKAKQLHKLDDKQLPQSSTTGKLSSQLPENPLLLALKHDSVNTDVSTPINNQGIDDRSLSGVNEIEEQKRPLWQRNEPFDNPDDERKRVNARKARKNREKKKDEKKKLEANLSKALKEVETLKRKLEEKQQTCNEERRVKQILLEYVQDQLPQECIQFMIDKD